MGTRGTEMITVPTVDRTQIRVFGILVPFSRFRFNCFVSYINGQGRSRHWHNRARDLYFVSCCWGFKGWSIRTSISIQAVVFKLDAKTLLILADMSIALDSQSRCLNVVAGKKIKLTHFFIQKLLQTMTYESIPQTNCP